MTPPRIVFMGTPEFARVILNRLVVSGAGEITGVVAQPSMPAGRGNKVTAPPVARFAIERSLPLIQPSPIGDEEALAQLRDWRPDIIVVAAYGRILPDSVLSLATRDIINVHASLLPRWRGAAPINYALMESDSETGVSIMRVVQELDAGPVYLDKRIVITADDDAVTLTNKLAELGGSALIEALPLVAAGQHAPLPQDNARATYAPKLTRELSPIDWHRPAGALFNQIRALVPWPVAESTLARKRVKILKARALNENPRGVPGEIVHIGREGLTVRAGEGAVLVMEMQLEGKKVLSAFDAANGLRVKTGDRFVATPP